MTEPVAAAGAAVSAQRRTLSGAFWGALAEGMALPAGLVLAAFLTRWLGPDGYGTYRLAAALVFWVEACLYALLARATITPVSRADDWRPAATTALRASGLGRA